MGERLPRFYGLWGVLGAGMHLAFAFPMIRQLLMMFNMNNLALFVRTTIISFTAFAALYIIVYKITSNAYCSIVSGNRRERHTAGLDALG